MAPKRKNESEESRTKRLKYQREYNANRRAKETDDEHSRRLETQRRQEVNAGQMKHLMRIPNVPKNDVKMNVRHGRMQPLKHVPPI